MPGRPAAAGPGAGLAQAPQADKIYVVKPPDGRYHESLWEIAQNHLGDGRRYAEIYELNKDRVQPDGSKLTIASLIRPGWVLRMPRDAFGPGIEVGEPAGRRGTGHQRRCPGRAGRVGRARHGSRCRIGRGHPGHRGPGRRDRGHGGPATGSSGGGRRVREWERH